MRSAFVRETLILLAAVLACSCGGTRYIPPDVAYEPADRYYAASFDEVWEELMTVFTDMEVSIENLETASGFIRSASFDATSTGFLDCGGYRPSPSYLRITALVQEDGGNTTVRLRELSGPDTYMSYSYYCEPTGTLSAAIYTSLDRAFR